MAHRWIRGLLVTAAALTLAGETLAVDGVIEINQARALAGGVTPGDTPGFPVFIDQPGSYRLTSNLDVRGEPDPQNVDAIVINPANVTIDLNGFSIFGPVECVGTPLACTPSGGTGIGVWGLARNSVTVLNGSVRGMGDFGIRLGSSARVHGVHVIDNGGTGISVDDHSLISDCTVERNGGFSGIGLGFGGSLRNSTIGRNVGIGVSASGGTIVVDNAIHDNQSFGLAYGNPAGSYVGNALTGNNGGDDAPTNPQVSGNAIQLGTNLCGTDTVCP